jgi:AcrR family transcriptional regulator
MGRKKLLTDEQLLQHARAVFLEQGIGGSTKTVANRAGISEAAVFKRYPTKASLFLAALRPQPPDIMTIFPARSPGQDAHEALIEICRNMLAYFRGLMPQVLHLMTYPGCDPQSIFSSFPSPPPVILTQGMVTFLEEAERRGEIRAADRLATAALLVSAMHSLAIFELMKVPGHDSMDMAVERFIEALWKGLGKVR